MSCERTAPYGPGEAPSSSTGFPLNGCPLIRDIQSMAFLSPPGREWLYSGEAITTPSAAAILSARRRAGSGTPDAVSMSPS
jgi:hypothetical protein